MDFPLITSARFELLRVVEELPDTLLRAWPDRSFSPICWHLGHVAFTEALWLLQPLGIDGFTKPFARRFAQNGCPKSERADGFDRDELFTYMDAVRDAVTAEASKIKNRDYYDWFLAAHEQQHRETIANVLCLAGGHASVAPLKSLPAGAASPRTFEFHAGTASVGSRARTTYDNERPRMDVKLQPFAIDARPATVAAYREFIANGGYRERRFWTEQGWEWCRQTAAEHPRSWEGSTSMRVDGRHELDPLEPVCGLSWYEADAYARYRGGRLPSEYEWEFVARAKGDGAEITGLLHTGPVAVTPRRTDFFGNVWEWTSSWFEPYPGFEPYPYREYSTPYFHQTHRVLRGGSFATSALLARASFRNWYQPEVNQIFSGVRVAYSG